MKPADIWSSETRFIELDVRSGELGTFLARQGFTRFLAISQNESRLATIASAHPALEPCLVYSSDAEVVHRNNANVLILSGASAFHLWKYRRLRHADDVVWCPALRLSTLVAALGLLLNILLRRYCWKGIVRYRGYSGRTRLLVVVGMRRQKRNATARYYVPHRLGMAGFLARLSEQGVRHAVLRWFESLPELPAGEDLDLLVADDEFQRVRAMLNEGPGIQPCDLYTITGLPGSDYQKMPYFPPYLAEALLAEARPHKAGCLVPSPRHYFLTLAYHAVYHKGHHSGLPAGHGAPRRVNCAEHDYTNILRKMAANLGVDTLITLDDLDHYLATQRWRPPRDMFTRLAARNRWVDEQVRESEAAPDDPGLAVFVVRAKGLEQDGMKQVISQIERGGFSPIKTKILAQEQSQYAARRIRGGNWGRGPWRVSGGLPAAVIVAYDLDPTQPTARQHKRFPHVSNARLLLKEQIREEFNRRLPKSQWCNVVHSSDNGHEALDYIRILMPEAASEIAAGIQDLRRLYGSGQRALKTLTRKGRRAKVELIDWNGTLAVRKTFKAHAGRFWRREADAMRHLSRTIPEIPPLLAVDEYSVVCPYYEDVLRQRWSEGQLLPLDVAKQAIEALRNIYEAGFALIDAHVENVLVDRQEGLKLIDFEFLYRYNHRPKSFEQCYDMAGCPREFDGDLPEEGGKSYATAWQPRIGLSLHSLLHDPTWLQHVKRASYAIVHQPRLLRNRVRSWRQGVRAGWTWLARQPMHQPPVDTAESPLVVELMQLDSSRDRCAA